MKRSILAFVWMVAVAVLISGASVVAQDLHREYALGAGGQIMIQNISGDIKVTGYGGTRIIVDAVRTGRDLDKVKVEDLSGGNKIELRVQYPEDCNCNASVDFMVQVPAGMDYSFERLTSVSGNVNVAGVRGTLKAKSVSGNVILSAVTGVMNASSVSGDVEVQIVNFAGSGEMKFSSVSGNVDVRAPGNSNLNIDMSTLSGALDTDFPIQIEEKKYGPGRSAKGQVGLGGTSFHLSTISGKVSLFRN